MEFNIQQFFSQCLSIFQPTASFSSGINEFFGHFNQAIATLFFFDLLFFTDRLQLPFIVVWLALGGLFFTLYFRFINIRAFWHAIQLTLGRFDTKGSKGEVSHFSALATALSATVGLGNIAGVAVAVSVGGPGAMFWMILAGFLGMTSKFTECSLAMLYRTEGADGHIMGGPMEYLSKGFAEKGMPRLGRFLALAFCLLTIISSLGGGGSFQVNQALNAVSESVPFLGEHRWLFGLFMALAVGVVIIGGIRRISSVAGKVVPLMCGVYVLACLYILVFNYASVPSAIGLIVSSAFSPEAGYGGFIGVMITGFRRAAFSCEAGVGSAAIAHSAAKAEHPVQEGIVALLEPFIDTVVICTMTALVIVITGAYDNEAYRTLIDTQQGAALTSRAMGEVIPWFPYVLSLSVTLFAFSSIISWSYYGERCFSYLFSEKYSLIYKIILCLVVFSGAITTAINVLNFGDLMILGMSLPNIIGLYVLAPRVKKEVNEYLDKLKSGVVKPTS